jgi:CubicO group peptidase (beta-lactamase class C family)
MITLNAFIKNKALLAQTTPIAVDSVFIQNGDSIEKHFFIEESLHELKSASKVMVAMAVGIAIDNKMEINGIPLTLETKVYPIIKHLVDITKKSNLQKIEKWTIRNLLTHSTGYEQQMLSERFIKDVEKSQIINYALNYDIPYEVGTRYAYNNVEPFLISVIFQEAFSINLADFIDEHIFKNLGITAYKWGNYGKYCIGASGLYLKHSDFHKIGQLLLFDGKYQNTQVVSADWIIAMCSYQIAATSEFKPERVLPKIGAGYFTFISRDGFVFRDGANGQYIILNKQQKLLTTIMSSEPEMKNVGEILRGLI